MQSDVEVPISFGDLFDKITILEIKLDNIRENRKILNVSTELDLLTKKKNDAGIPDNKKVFELISSLKKTNKNIWDAEDVIRDLDRRGDFGQNFVDVARSIYRLNDARAQLKREINILLGSKIIEEKGYSSY